MSVTNNVAKATKDKMNTSKFEADAFDCEGEVKVEKLVPSTVRFSSEADKAFSDLAEEYRVSKAKVIRLAAAGGLAKYLGNLRYVDKAQGLAINHNICELSNEIYKIREQLRRIGINYNQEVKLKNIERKREVLKSGGSIDFMTIEQRIKLDEEEKKIRENEGLLNKKELEELMEQFVKSTEKVGEILWRILG